MLNKIFRIAIPFCFLLAVCFSPQMQAQQRSAQQPSKQQPSKQQSSKQQQPSKLQQRSKQQLQQQRPNIIFILADDMGFGDISGLNKNAKVRTPNLDRLMQEGMHFTDAHSASAVCTPSRYALLTGRYAWRGALKKSVLWEYDPPLIEADRLTLGDMLQEKGYATACIGKWHLGWDWRLKNGAYWKDSAAPRDGPGSRARGSMSGLVDFTAPMENGPTTRGFDYYFGVDVPNFPPYCYFENDRLTRQPDTMKPDTMFGVKGAMQSGWSLEAVMPELTARAVKYIEEKAGAARPATAQAAGTAKDSRAARSARAAQRQNQAAANQPFFLYFPLTAPHTPIAPTAEFLGKSQAGLYGDFVEQVDWTVGEIMRAVRENGLSESTIIVFSSDNGSPANDGANMGGAIGSVRRFGHEPSYIFRGVKADIYEGGHRVPLIVSWPGQVKSGTVNDQTVCLVDWMATCADITNTPLPQDAGEDSYSLLPLLLQTDPHKYDRPYTIHHSISGYFAIRQGDWKLILGAGSGGWSAPRPGKEEEGLPPIQLYNLNTDIGEKYNAADERPDVVNQLQAQLEKCIRDGRTKPYSKLNIQDSSTTLYSKPNVILIMTDDMGYETVSYNGALNFQTPNIDALARESTVFTNCDAQPLCVPSRVQLITGQYNYRNYTGWNSFNLEMPALGKIMRDAGYATGVFGKWHLGKSPEELGFSDYSLFNGSPGNLSYAEFFKRYFYNCPLKETAGDYVAAYAPDRFNQQLLQFIDKHKAAPFFIYYPMSLAHNPFQPTPDSQDPDCRDWQRNFEDMVAYADKLIGRVIAKLKQTGLYDNTVIIYTADNGTKTLAHSMINGTTIYGGKGIHANDGCHVPLFVKYDGEHRVSEELVDFTDFYPTLAEIAGYDLKPVREKIDGASLVPVLKDKKGRDKPYIFSTFFEPLSGYIRDAQYKLYYDGRLFDIKNDPRELRPYYLQNDIARTTAARKTLQAELTHLLEETALSRYPAKKRLQDKFGPLGQEKDKLMLGGFIFDSLRYTPRQEKIKMDITDFLHRGPTSHHLRIARMYQSSNSGLIYANAVVKDVKILYDGKIGKRIDSGDLALSTERDYKKLKETGNPLISFVYKGDNETIPLGELSIPKAGKVELEVDLEVFNPDNQWGDRLMLYFFLEGGDHKPV